MKKKNKFRILIAASVGEMQATLNTLVLWLKLGLYVKRETL